MARGNQRELARQKAQKKQSEQQKRKAASDKDSNKGLSLDERRRRDAENIRLKQLQKAAANDPQTTSQSTTTTNTTAKDSLATHAMTA